jgi:hypothetical protein
VRSQGEGGARHPRASTVYRRQSSRTDFHQTSENTNPTMVVCYAVYKKFYFLFIFAQNKKADDQK